MPAVAAVLLVRAVVDADRGVGIALGELGLYVLVTVLATLGIERALIREVIGYLRRDRAPTPLAAGS